MNGTPFFMTQNGNFHCRVAGATGLRAPKPQVMTVVIPPSAQDDLLSLQDYMLDKWSEADWLKAEDEIFEKLSLVDRGFLSRAPVQEPASVGIFGYQNVSTSHHKLVNRRIDGDVYVYAVAGHRQDFPTLLMRRLLKI